MVTLVLDYDRGESFYRIAVSIKRFPVHIRQNQRAVAADNSAFFGNGKAAFRPVENFPEKRINQAIDYIKSPEELPFPKPDEQ